MSDSNLFASKLPERASLEYLKKLAKDRLEDLRRSDPKAKLAAAQLAVARDHGFPSWRALRAEIEERRTRDTSSFFEACAKGDVEALRAALAADAGLVRATRSGSGYGGWTGLHSAAQGGHLNAARLLLEQGADPNAREAGDNTYPLHWAAAGRHIEIVRALLNAGGDVHGLGDVHELDAIGWATYFHPEGGAPGDKAEVAAFLVERGARHHIFSAISIGELELIRRVVEQDPEALERRMSRFEKRLTPVHFAISLKRYDVLDLLIELGADVEAGDQSGQTALSVAMLRGDREAMKRLDAAAAKQPERIALQEFREGMVRRAGSVKKIVPMISVADVSRALDWYVSIGFKELGRVEAGGQVNWGMVGFGKAEIMLNIGGKVAAEGVSLWLYTDSVEELYRLLKSRQMEAARAALSGEGDERAVEFVEDIYNPPYGGREFGIRDFNGYHLYFLQPE